MNVIALGGYFKQLRESRGWNHAEVAVAMKRQLGRNVSPSTIWKYENGGIKTPGSDMILALMLVLKGRAEDMWALISDDSASPARGAELARHASDEGLRSWVEGLTSDQIARLRDFLDSD